MVKNYSGEVIASSQLDNRIEIECFKKQDSKRDESRKQSSSCSAIVCVYTWNCKMDSSLLINALIILILGSTLWLTTQRWFWLLAFGIGAIASAFSTLASIFYFEILWALGFFFLTIICGLFFQTIADDMNLYNKE
jgi:hypothetical protein